jgi:membrane protein DedA with SNARE-associated domain
VSRLTKFLLSAGILTAIAVAVGFLLSTDDGFDWGLTLILVGIAIAGEGLRTWIRRGRAKRNQGSGI